MTAEHARRRASELRLDACRVAKAGAESHSRWLDRYAAVVMAEGMHEEAAAFEAFVRIMEPVS